jgi:predicted Fe-Mo cluster-binding NifX family protein
LESALRELIPDSLVLQESINNKDIIMKIAVTSKGEDLSSPVDPRFGRAAYIIIVDPETMEYETLNNQENINALKGAGIKAASMISDKGVEYLLTGFCGPNAITTLNAANIKVGVETTGSVQEAVEAFNSGQIKLTDSANAEGHWT